MPLNTPRLCACLCSWQAHDHRKRTLLQKDCVMITAMTAHCGKMFGTQCRAMHQAELRAAAPESAGDAGSSGGGAAPLVVAVHQPARLLRQRRGRHQHHRGLLRCIPLQQSCHDFALRCVPSLPVESLHDVKAPPRLALAGQEEGGCHSNAYPCTDACMPCVVWGRMGEDQRSASATSVTGIASAAAGVPWLSWRAGAFHLVTQAAPGFRSEHLYCDRIHPNFLGHRCFCILSCRAKCSVRSKYMRVLDAGGCYMPGLNGGYKVYSQKSCDNRARH